MFPSVIYSSSTRVTLHCMPHLFIDPRILEAQLANARRFLDEARGNFLDAQRRIREEERAKAQSPIRRKTLTSLPHNARHAGRILGANSLEVAQLITSPTPNMPLAVDAAADAAVDAVHQAAPPSITKRGPYTRSTVAERAERKKVKQSKSAAAMLKFDEARLSAITATRQVAT